MSTRGTIVARSVSSATAVPLAAVLVDGSSIDPRALASAWEPFLGHTLDREGLVALARAIARRAQALGLPLASARIVAPPDAGGLVRVKLEDGRLAHVELPPVAAGLGPLLAPLADGHPVTQAELERRLLLAEDVPGVSVLSKRLRRDGESETLAVDAKCAPVSGSVTLTNDGTGNVGPLRALFALEANHLLAFGDALSLFALTTPEKPREASALYARYSQQVGPDGLQLGLFGSYSLSRPSGVLRSVDTRIDGWNGGADLSYPLARAKAASLWGTLSVELAETRQYQLDFMTSHDRSVIVRAGLSGFVQALGGRVRGGVSVSQGIDALGATPRDDLRASRSGASPGFTKALLWGEGSWKLARATRLRLNVESQWASGPLLLGEQFSLGGRCYGRAYDYGERLGDEGVGASAELAQRIYGKGKFDSEAYGFVDGGRVRNIRPEVDGPARGLASAGAGVRLKLGRVRLTGEAAWPLADARYASGSRAARWIMSLSYTL